MKIKKLEKYGAIRVDDLIQKETVERKLKELGFIHCGRFDTRLFACCHVCVYPYKGVDDPMEKPAYFFASDYCPTSSLFGEPRIVSYSYFICARNFENLGFVFESEKKELTYKKLLADI